MKPFIDISNFSKYLNEKNTISTFGTSTTMVIRNDFKAMLLMRAEHDYKENYTVEFNLVFEHKKHNEEGRVFQKEFKIEHHPKDKSRHTKPHVQIYMHGPAKPDKVGQMWVTLPLEKEDEYIRCIKGFFSILENVINSCEDNLDKEILNLNEVRKLGKQREFLLEKINESLRNNAIEFRNPKGEKVILYPKDMSMFLQKNKLLLPFFEN